MKAGYELFAIEKVNGQRRYYAVSDKLPMHPECHALARHLDKAETATGIVLPETGIIKIERLHSFEVIQ